MKIRIIENEDPLGGNKREVAELDLVLTPKEGVQMEDIISALENPNNYGKYISNMRNKKEIEAGLIKKFGPNLPTHKRPLEKKQGFPFPPKTKQGVDDFIRSFNSKPNIVTYEEDGKGRLIFPTSKNSSKVNTTNVIKQVMNTAKIPYTLKDEELLKEYSLKRLLR